MDNTELIESDPDQRAREEVERRTLAEEYRRIRSGEISEENYTAGRLAERRRARELSDHDPNLPLLLNRKAFLERTVGHLGEKVRELQDGKIQGITGALLMLDIDHFKTVNDQYGHPKGNEVLVTLTDVLHNNLKRPGDLVGRYGGEEFVVYLPDTGLEGAIMLAEILRLAIQSSFTEQFPELEWDKTVSIGLQAIPEIPREEMVQRLRFTDDRADLIGALIEDADRGLYAAKRSGRNTIGVVIDGAAKIASVQPDPGNPTQKTVTYEEPQS